MAKVNILYVETGLGFGGAVTCLAALLKGLNKERYHPIVISSHNDISTRRLIEKTGVQFLYVKKYQREKTVNMFLCKVLKYGKVIKGIVLIAVRISEKIREVPFCVRLMKIIKKHNINMMHLNTGVNVNLDSIVVSKLMGIPCICHVRGDIYSCFEAKLIAKFVTHFIAISRFVKKSIVDLVGTPQNIAISYDGVDLDECERMRGEFEIKKTNQYSFGKHNVGLFSCLLQWKGHKVFIKAIEILVKKGDARDCNFFIVGDSPDGKSKLKEELTVLTNRLGLSDYIFFTGHQDNVYQFMDRMDIIVHTSIEPEPFGRVIIEAMALGKIVIATNIGGPLEIIQNGVDGILIPPCKPKVLAEAISSLLHDKPKWQNISKCAQETARKRFNLDNYIKEVEHVYEQTLVK